jgi:hypothetical protein
MFFNKQLENQLEFKSCEHSSCPVKMLEWDIDSHSKECEYSPQKCFFCSTMITSETFREHIKQDCFELEWMETTEEATSGTINLGSRIKITYYGFTINILDLQANFTILYDDLMVLAIRKVDGWYFAAIHSKERACIDIYTTSIQTTVYDTRIISTLKCSSSLKDIPPIQELPKLPLCTHSIDFVVNRPDHDDIVSLPSIHSGDFFND